jgi:hypothetical protein
MFASATVEIWTPTSMGLERLEASAAFHWDVEKDWPVFVAEVADIADKMLMNNDPNERAYIVIKFTTKECKLQFRKADNGEINGKT